MRVLLLVLLLPAVALAVIDGRDDTLTIASIFGGNTYPNRTSYAGFIRADGILTADGRTAQRGRWSDQAAAVNYGGVFYSTTAGTNDWVSGDFVADVYWFPSVFDTLLRCCMGTAVLDTQYIDSVALQFTMTQFSARADTIFQAKVQGPFLSRAKPPNAATASTAFGTTGVDSAPCFNWLRRATGTPNDTVYWRDTSTNGAPAVWDSASILGDDFADYELTLTSGSNYSTRFDVGRYSQQSGMEGHSDPIIVTLPSSIGTRFSVNITTMFKTAMAACAASAANMAAEGFGVLINWVHDSNTSSERIQATKANSYMRIAVHNNTTGSSMALRIYFKTNLDSFCANKMKDAGAFRVPWYLRAASLVGTRRDRIQGVGVIRKDTLQ